MRILFILIFLLTTGLIGVYGQNCSQILRQARTVYDEGRIQALPDMLQGCIDNGFTDEERTEAYRLLILAYLYLDEAEQADATMLALLEDNPQFQINEQADPAELINLYNTFRTKPIFSYGFKGGGNITLIQVLNTYGVHRLDNSDGQYELKPGFQVAAVIEKILKPRLTASLEIYFTGNFNTYTNNFVNTDSLGRFLESQTIILSQSTLSVPVTVQYEVLTDSKYHPYIFGGLSVQYLMSSTFNGETNTASESFEGATVDILNQRKTLNFSGVLGVGSKIQVGKNTFVSELRFNMGLLNQVEESERFTNQTLIYDYGYIDNDFKLHSISLSIGYLLPFYDPKKLTDN
ncbi:MAG: porin family protein [Fulvivirga sp.]|nr:porin family protein [Fulvivirga sp.]